MKKNIWVIVMLALGAGIPAPAHALFEDKEKEAMRAELETVKKEIETVKADRDNVLAQAKVFLKDKEDLLRKIEEIKGGGAQTRIEVDSLKKENELLKSETEKLRAVREKDRELQRQEIKAREERIAELQAQADSLAKTMEEYSPVRIQEMVEDRNRLEKEANQLAAQLVEREKEMASLRIEVKPLELDREELHRLREEAKELRKRASYMGKLEERQRQLLKENAEYREELEVMKAKFKEAVPGLAKHSRISQKMMRENADMHYNLGTLFLNNKQYREAIKEFERVIELRPSDPETHYNLGVLYDDFLKDREKALYHYQKYLTINPRAPDAKKVESYILQLELEQKVR